MMPNPWMLVPKQLMLVLTSTLNMSSTTLSIGSQNVGDHFNNQCWHFNTESFTQTLNDQPLNVTLKHWTTSLWMLALKIVEHKTKRCSSQLSNLPVEQLLRSSSSVEENLSLWTRVVENLLSLYGPDFGRRVFLSMAQDGREFLSRNPVLGEEYFSL